MRRRRHALRVDDVHLKWFDARSAAWKTFCGRPVRDRDVTDGACATCPACRQMPVPAALLMPDGPAAGDDS